MRHALLALLLVPGVFFAKTPEPPPGMVFIPGGDYKPLYAKEATPRTAPAFFMDAVQVTNAQFLNFVVAHPEWRRSQVRSAQADSNYLKHWAGDLDLGTQAPQKRP
jgi:sulfatase modifying factor 1